uniref:DUF4115 domain-containing protein n=1 Tax=Rhabditophanes sp. KR3021 TaxID=114890 RepID=A0AC35TVU3_9BILA
MFVIILLLLAIGAIFYLANDPSAIRKIKEYGGTPGPNDTNSSSAIPGVATAVPPNSTSLKKSPKKSDVKTPAATSSIRTAVSNVDSTRTAVSIRSKRVKKVGPVLGSASTQELKRDVEDLAASTPVGK